MGMKHRIGFGMYVINGSINCQLAEKTGFTDEDAEKIKQALLTLFENDLFCEIEKNCRNIHG